MTEIWRLPKNTSDRVTRARKLKTSRQSSSTSEPIPTPTSSDSDSADDNISFGHFEDESFETQQSIEDITALIIEKVFGVNLEDLSNPSDAWSSVKCCLKELSATCFAEKPLRQHPLDIFETIAYQNPNSSSTSSGPSGNNNTDRSADVNSKQTARAATRVKR